MLLPLHLLLRGGVIGKSRLIKNKINYDCSGAINPSVALCKCWMLVVVCVCCGPSKHQLMSHLNGAADDETLLHAGNV